MSRREEVGPIVSLAGMNKPLEKPACEFCKSGQKNSTDLPGRPSVCPKCGRLLCNEI